MWGGCPARAPPDVNQIEMEVTWEEGKVHQESRDHVRSPSCGDGEDGALLTSTPTSPHIASNPPQSPVALGLPVPWMTVCSGKPGSGSRPLAQEVVSLPPGAGAASTIFHREQPAGTSAAMGATSFASVLSLVFSSFLRICVPHALVGSVSLELRAFKKLGVPGSSSFSWPPFAI